MQSLQDDKVSKCFTGPLFPELELPPISEIPEYQRSQQLLTSLLYLPAVSPGDQGLELPSIRKTRGAPTKPKNQLVNVMDLKNTKGKPFKFSFVPQILVSHLQHLIGNKKKPRSQIPQWLRSDFPHGRAIQQEIRELVGPNRELLNFKRVVSVGELAQWLHGGSFCHPSAAELATDLRTRVFRLFCILKCIDLEGQYANDFSVVTTDRRAAGIFKQYLTRYMWEDMGMVPISEEEAAFSLRI